MNVVSTSPSGTEILAALGVEPVAVSHACDYPPSIRDKPRIDASSIEGGSSADRHRAVRETSDDGHVYDVDAERLRAAEPDLIVTQEVCGVCAVDETLIESVLADLPVDPDVLGLGANRLDDVFRCIREVGAATGRDERAEALVGELRCRIRAVTDRVDAVESSPRTLVVEWMDPIHVAGNWVPELVDRAGGEYGLVAPGEGSTETSWAEIRDYAPEVVVVAPCSYDLDDTRRRIDELATRPGWSRLPAVENDRVYAMDGSSYLSRWTPRLVDAFERLAAVLHPEVFDARYEDVVSVTAPAGSTHG